jgi:hypothetical protein
MFKRIAAACPVDYYWLWTPEDWTWGGNKPGQLEATTLDLQLALAALSELGNPFTLATSGWVLGPAHNRAALDEFLPKTSPMSCINRQVGHEGVEPAFANVIGRPKWAIPWMENDPEHGRPATVGRADAPRRGGRAALRLHRSVRHPLAHEGARAERRRARRRRVGSVVGAGRLRHPAGQTRSKGGEGAIGGAWRASQRSSCRAGQTPAAVYQHVRYNLDGYTLNVPDGNYTVTLQFNEPAYSAAGKRVFGAKIQGRQVLDQPGHLRPRRTEPGTQSQLPGHRGDERRAADSSSPGKSNSPASPASSLTAEPRRTTSFPASRSRAG